MALACERRSLVLIKCRGFGASLEVDGAAVIPLACFANFLALPFNRGAATGASVGLDVAAALGSL
jgi:ABC-type cobalamin transport system permease subunit